MKAIPWRSLEYVGCSYVWKLGAPVVCVGAPNYMLEGCPYPVPVSMFVLGITVRHGALHAFGFLSFLSRSVLQLSSGCPRNLPGFPTICGSVTAQQYLKGAIVTIFCPSCRLVPQ